MKESGFGERKTVWDSEGDLVNFGGSEGGETSRDQQGVDGAPRFQNSHGKIEVGRVYAVDSQPVDRTQRLIVTARVVTLGNIMEGVARYGVGVQVGLEREICERTFWRHYKAAVQTLKAWRLQKEVEDLRGIEVHEGVVHEDDLVTGKRGRSGGIANCVCGSQTEVHKLGEVWIDRSQSFEL